MAPYEADAQMAFLAISGSVHAVITEDSDLLTYGCPRVRSYKTQAIHLELDIPLLLLLLLIYRVLKSIVVVPWRLLCKVP